MVNFSVTGSFKRRSQSIDVVFIDVRTSAEFRSIHAEGAVNLPMQTLELGEITFAKEDEIHVICQSGGRSMKGLPKTGDCRVYQCS
jgi:rhodanese-related sulfurtransferase